LPYTMLDTDTYFLVIPSGASWEHKVLHARMHSWIHTYTFLFVNRNIYEKATLFFRNVNPCKNLSADFL
jgi:hypothetical protein